MARNGLRTRPPGVDPRAADGDGRRIPFAFIPHHTLILLARASDPYSLPRPRNGNFAHESRSDGLRNLLSKLSTPCSRRHWFCIVAILCSRSLTQAGPWIIATQPALNALPRRDLGF